MKSGTSLTFELLRERHDPAAIIAKLGIRGGLQGCESVLDVGCGASPTMRKLGAPRISGIEGHQPAVEAARRLKTHDDIIQGDVRNLMQYFKPKQFDGCVALDVIEHVVKEDGLKMLADMEKIARKRVVILTPCGFLPQRHATNDDLQEHLSGWEPAEMRALGYDVIGLLGPKKLRGEYHALKQPRAFWGVVSLAGHFLWTRSHPEKAAAILCIKDMTRS